MIFQKSLRRDLASLAGVVFSTLFTIMVTTSLIRSGISPVTSSSTRARRNDARVGYPRPGPVCISR